MNIAEFTQRMKEQAERLQRLADTAAEAPDNIKAGCFYMMSRELDTLERRIGLTRAWLKKPEGETNGEATKEGSV